MYYRSISIYHYCTINLQRKTLCQQRVHIIFQSGGGKEIWNKFHCNYSQNNILRFELENSILCSGVEGLNGWCWMAWWITDGAIDLSVVQWRSDNGTTTYSLLVRTLAAIMVSVLMVAEKPSLAASLAKILSRGTSREINARPTAIHEYWAMFAIACFWWLTLLLCMLAWT